MDVGRRFFSLSEGRMIILLHFSCIVVSSSFFSGAIEHAGFSPFFSFNDLVFFFNLIYGFIYFEGV